MTPEDLRRTSNDAADDALTILAATLVGIGALVLYVVAYEQASDVRQTIRCCLR